MREVIIADLIRTCFSRRGSWVTITQLEAKVIRLKTAGGTDGTK